MIQNCIKLQLNMEKFILVELINCLLSDHNVTLNKCLIKGK